MEPATTFNIMKNKSICFVWDIYMLYSLVKSHNLVYKLTLISFEYLTILQCHKRPKTGSQFDQCSLLLAMKLLKIAKYNI